MAEVNMSPQGALEALEDSPCYIQICIFWVNNSGDDDVEYFDYADVSELKHGLINFKVYNPNFYGITLHVRPQGSTIAIVKDLLNYIDIVIEKDMYVYSSNELKKIFKKLLAWIDERPELLI